MKTNYKDYCDVCGCYQTHFDKKTTLNAYPDEPTPTCVICESELEEIGTFSTSTRERKKTTD